MSEPGFPSPYPNSIGARAWRGRAGLLGSLCAALVLASACGSSQAPADRATPRPALTDTAAAGAVVHVDHEIRPGNERANVVEPSSSELTAFRSASAASTCAVPLRYVTGAYSGKTDEIIQWAAAKWGLPPDAVRAVAVVESGWNMDVVGDKGESFGITQIKRTAHPGTYPLSARSTAFNLDYYGAVMRCYMAGLAQWLNDDPRGRKYEAGDLWGSVGAWYSGHWYAHNDDYLAEVRAAQTKRPWREAGF